MATTPVAASPINMQDFLRILVSQLNNQDPLKPMDNQEFVTQMAQFTSLQQTQILNENMEKLLSTQGAMQSVGLIGKTVTISNQDGSTAAGTVSALQFVDSEPKLTVTLSTTNTDMTGVSLSQLVTVRYEGIAMFDSISIGMSGMVAFSKGLKVIGNNVANINTPGFKSSDLQFADMFYQGGDSSGGGDPLMTGTGVNTLSTYLNFKDGETRQTGNALDMSIDGEGFFVTKDPNYAEASYSRAGQFEFTKEGELVSRGSGKQVMGRSPDGTLAGITLDGLRVNAPKPTTKVKFTGNLVLEDTTHTVSAINLIDGSGAKHTVSMIFAPKAGDDGAWTVALVDGTTTTPIGEVAYSLTSPVAGRDSITFTYTPADSAPMEIALDFSGTTSFSNGSGTTGDVGSSLGVTSIDGAIAGTLTKVAFDDKGVLTATYSNGATATGPQLAIATFQSKFLLVQSGAGEFTAGKDQTADIGRAGEDGVGSIVSNQVETSNVDLAAEFSNLIVMQRGYQASSRIVTTADEMLKELFEMKGGR